MGFNNIKPASSKPEAEYYVRNLTDDSFVRVCYGVKGYHPAPNIDAKKARELNDYFGHNNADVRAAEICSMTGRWEKFDGITKQFDSIAVT